MVMKQNWMTSLSVITLSFLFIHCRQGMDVLETHYYAYSNETSHRIQMKVFSRDGSIDSLNLAPNTKTIPSYQSFFSVFDDDFCSVTFDDKKIIIYTSNYPENECGNGQRSPYCRNANNFSYDLELEWEGNSRVDFIFTYAFTEEDYRNATPLVFGEGFVGSVWRCTEGAGLQEGLVYNELRFVSESQVEGWGQLEGEPEPELFFTATYSIDGETITITEDSESFTATLNETFTGLVTNIDNEGECIFIKQ